MHFRGGERIAFPYITSQRCPHDTVECEVLRDSKARVSFRAHTCQWDNTHQNASTCSRGAPLALEAWMAESACSHASTSTASLLGMVLR